MPLAEPQVPADPVTPKTPLPPAAVDGFLRHAQIGSQLLHREEPVRAAHRSRVPGSPVPDRCTLDSSRMVKVVAVCAAGGHGSLRLASPRQGQAVAARLSGAVRAEEWGSRAVADGAVLLPVRCLVHARAGEQDGLARRPGPVPPSAHCARHVKSVTGGWPPAQHAAVLPDGTAGPGASGGEEATVRPGRRARPRPAPGRG